MACVKPLSSGIWRRQVAPSSPPGSLAEAVRQVAAGHPSAFTATQPSAATSRDLSHFTEVAQHALDRAAALLQELRDIDGEGSHLALADPVEEALREAGGHDEEGVGAVGGGVGEGVGGIAAGVLAVDLDQVLAEALAQALHPAGLERVSVGEEMAAARAECTQGSVTVIVGLEDELDAQDRTLGPDDLLQQRLDASVGTEAVDPLPRGDR